MTWVIAVIALAGALANIHKKWWCFLLWLVSNAYWIWHNFHIAEYSQAFVFTVFWFLAAYGIYRWRKDQKSVAQAIEKAVAETRALSSKQVALLLGENLSMKKYIRSLPVKYQPKNIRKD